MNFLVYLHNDGAVHLRHYHDRDEKVMQLDLEEIEESPFIRAAVIVRDAMSYEHARSFALGKWINDGILKLPEAESC